MKVSELSGAELDKYAPQREAQTTHGMKGTPTYIVWERMKSRCQNKNSHVWKYYGGRGITVCREWQKFEQFFKDMGIKPKGLSIDRIDNDKGYTKKNCRWVSMKVQNRNRRNNAMVTFNGKTQCLKEWAEELGIRYGTVWWRYKNGWSTERMLS